jgi:predicted AlkP superfamily pyrophosphatase or phosphodiesterase
MSIIIGLIAILLPTSFIFVDKLIAKLLPQGSLAEIEEEYNAVITSDHIA